MQIGFVIRYESNLKCNTFDINEAFLLFHTYDSFTDILGPYVCFMFILQNTPNTSSVYLFMFISYVKEKSYNYAYLNQIYKYQHLFEDSKNINL